MKPESKHPAFFVFIVLAAIFFFVDFAGAQAPMPKIQMGGYQEVPYTPGGAQKKEDGGDSGRDYYPFKINICYRLGPDSMVGIEPTSPAGSGATPDKNPDGTVQLRSDLVPAQRDTGGGLDLSAPQRQVMIETPFVSVVRSCNDKFYKALSMADIDTVGTPSPTPATQPIQGAQETPILINPYGTGYGFREGPYQMQSGEPTMQWIVPPLGIPPGGFSKPQKSQKDQPWEIPPKQR
ncbi:MAG: hypothetical protein ACREQP_21765 [Candidatus Binatia bacterium]